MTSLGTLSQVGVQANLEASAIFSNFLLGTEITSGFTKPNTMTNLAATVHGVVPINYRARARLVVFKLSLRDFINDIEYYLRPSFKKTALLA